MEPAFKAISDLFAVVPMDDLDIPDNPRKKEGRNAQESEELGRACLSDGDFQAAIRHFKNAISQRPADDITAALNLAGAYEYGDQYPQAYRQYEKALRAKVDAVEPHVGKSDLFRRHGRFRDSIEELQRATDLEPGNAFLHIKLAEVLRDAGEPKRAALAAQKAVIAKPDDAFYHYWLGDLFLAQGRYEEALESLRAAIELSPGDDYLYLRAAVGFWRVERKQEAIKAVRLASDLDPAKNLYHALLVILLEESGSLEDAAQESERAKKMDRYDHDLLGRLLDEMGIEP